MRIKVLWRTGSLAAMITISRNGSLRTYPLNFDTVGNLFKSGFTPGVYEIGTLPMFDSQVLTKVVTSQQVYRAAGPNNCSYQLWFCDQGIHEAFKGQIPEKLWVRRLPDES